MVYWLTLFDIKFLINLYGFWFSVELTLYLIRLFYHIKFSIRNRIGSKSTFGIWSASSEAYLRIISWHGAFVTFNKVIWKTVFDSWDVWLILSCIDSGKWDVTVFPSLLIARSNHTFDGQVVKCLIFEFLDWWVALEFELTVFHFRCYVSPRNAGQ